MSAKMGRPTKSKKGPRVRASISLDPALLPFLDRVSKGNRSEWINGVIQAAKENRLATFSKALK